MSSLFPRARDPDVFPPTVSRWSVTIPEDADPAQMVAGVALPAALTRATAKRKIQFFAGRLCALRAMERLAPASPVVSVPQDADGVPVWPAGLVGSISHADGFATAAVASSSLARGIGVDIEPVMSREIAAEIAQIVAGEAETWRVAEAAGLDAAEALTLVFSMKESLFKALFPASRRHFDYLDCEVVRLDPGKRRFVLRFSPAFAAVFGAAEFAGRYELADGAARTGVLVARRNAP